MKVKKTVLSSLVLSLVLMSLVQVIAVPVEVDAQAGDLYRIKTIRGRAVIAIYGQRGSVPASIELLCEITEVRERLILFKIVEGKLKIDGHSFAVTSGKYSGISTPAGEEAAVEAWGVDCSGRRIRFVLFGRTVRRVPEGAVMRLEGNLWGLGHPAHLRFLVLRQKVDS